MAASFAFPGKVSEQHFVQPNWWLVLLLCLLSRVLTAIHYIEDPDSLRFALGVIDFDVANLQPHFPGYPVFCFLVKILYLITDRFAYAFSIMGGLATFLLLWSGYRVFASLFGTGYVWIYLLLLFFNPMIWLLGNRYMPDLTGAALAMACLAVFPQAQHGERKYVLLFFVLAGLLAGVRLSYVPIILVPAGLLLLRPGRWLGLAAGITGVLLWLVPLILDTGWSNLIESATTHTEGHFTEWGGTVLSEPSHLQRLQRTLQFVWAHGLGGYWPGRHWISAVFGGFLMLAASGILFKSFRYKVTFSSKTTSQTKFCLVLFASALVYLLWIYFYQNVVHQSRHVLPLLPLLLLIPAFGCAVLAQKMKSAAMFVIVLMLAINVWITAVLVGQHSEPTSVYQVKEKIQANAREGQVILSLEMINQYLQLQGIQADFLTAEHDLQRAKTMLLQGKTVWVVGTFPELEKIKPAEVSVHYHNPYMNSLWPEVTLYRYGN